jgi:hypothetical protein
MKQIPVVLCEPVGNPGRINWRFWCEFCKTNHSHGAMPGHRSAHCHDKASPFKESGYILELRPAA